VADSLATLLGIHSAKCGVDDVLVAWANWSIFAIAIVSSHLAAGYTSSSPGSYSGAERPVVEMRSIDGQSPMVF